MPKAQNALNQSPATLTFRPTRPTWSRRGFIRRRTGFPAGPCQNLTAEAACRRLGRPRRHPAPDRAQPDRRRPAEQDCEWNGGFEGRDPSPGCTCTRAETCRPALANTGRSGRSGNPQRAAPPRRPLLSKHFCDDKDHDRTANASAEEQVQHCIAGGGEGRENQGKVTHDGKVGWYGLFRAFLKGAVGRNRVRQTQWRTTAPAT